jgi:lipoyl(octanoyl) transferase
MRLEPSPNLLQPRDDTAVLQAYLLGSVEFGAALDLQRLLAYQVAGDRDQAALILCEHPPIITLGRQGSRTHLLLGAEELQLRGWRARWVNRGGGTLLHVPGQMAIYPILPLDRMRMEIPEYLHRLRLVLAAVLDDFSLRGVTPAGAAGLHVGGRLIADCGVAVRDWVAYYGAVLNVNPDLAHFRSVRCGVPPAEATSIERERRSPLRTALVRERFLEHFASHFGFARTSLFFHHPSLPRMAPSDAVAAR